MTLSFGKKAKYVWNGLKSMLVSSSKTQGNNDAGGRDVVGHDRARVCIKVRSKSTMPL